MPAIMNFDMREHIAAGAIVLRDYSKNIKARNIGPCGPYYFVPGPLITGREPEGFGGYLNDDGDALDAGSFVRLRVLRADSILVLPHTGYYMEEDTASDLAYGIVARLPHSRGFLAGWTLGPNMTAQFSRDIYDTAERAAYHADHAAEHAAEREREYRAAEDAQDTTP